MTLVQTRRAAPYVLAVIACFVSGSCCVICIPLHPDDGAGEGAGDKGQAMVAPAHVSAAGTPTAP